MKKYSASQELTVVKEVRLVKHYYKENFFTCLPVSIALAIM
jgi:hypothetical protein